MDSFTESARVALGLVAGGDPRLWAVVVLSLQVSALACLLAGAFGLAAGAWLAVAQFPGRRMVLTLVNTLLALPSVVVGLVMYLLLSRSGPLGSLGLLFSPTAMVLAQAVLVLPVLTALTRQAIEGPWRDHGDQIRSLGAPRWLGGCLLLWDERLAILTVLLGGGGCDGGGRQHRWFHARDDHHHCTGNQQGRPAAGTGPGAGAAGRGAGAECGRCRAGPVGAPAARSRPCMRPRNPPR
jgi:ABC-type tungstate transport system substrate-binding protein